MYSGTVPTVIGNLLNLDYLVLSINNLNGDECLGYSLFSIINWLLWILLYYILYLLGAIPSAIGSLTKLTDLELAGNSFTGMLLHIICRLCAWRIYAGTIPSSFGSLTIVKLIALTSNSLQGNCDCCGLWYS